MSYEACELGLSQADQIVTHNPARVFYSFVRSDANLGGEGLAIGKDGRADDCGEFGIDQRLPAYKLCALPPA